MSIETLSAEYLRAVVPSVFASSPVETVSSSYGFVPTVQILYRLEEKGFKVRDALSSGNRDYGAHTLRLFNGQDERFSARTLKEGDIFPELIPTNSHDGSRSFSLSIGLFRLICTNGLCAGTAEFTGIVLPHKGFHTLMLNEGLMAIADAIPSVWDLVKDFSNIGLTNEQKLDFAYAAHSLFKDGELNAEDLLEARREEDLEPTLWNVLNIAQENMLKGGVRRKTGSRTRAISSSVENLRLNKGIWQVAQDFREFV